jgi:hypothetical protein
MAHPSGKRGTPIPKRLGSRALCSKIYTLQLFTKFRSPVWPLDPIRYPHAP